MTDPAWSSVCLRAPSPERAEVPLAELFGYATQLRSLTKGRASYSMEPGHFEIVPESLQAGLINR